MLPDVPTVAEGGMPGFQALSWQGVFAPSGTPKPVLARLHAEIAKVLRADDVQKFFSDRGFVVESRAPDESQAFVEAEVRRWKRVVDEAGLKTK
jgi:tripartite-type tricarboxylate transporter receptor subunit TctC